MVTFGVKEEAHINKLSKEEKEAISKFLHGIAEYLYTGESDWLVDSIVSIKSLRDTVTDEAKGRNLGGALSIHLKALGKKADPNFDCKKFHEEKKDVKEFCICLYP